MGLTVHSVMGGGIHTSVTRPHVGLNETVGEYSLRWPERMFIFTRCDVGMNPDVLALPIHVMSENK